MWILLPDGSTRQVSLTLGNLGESAAIHSRLSPHRTTRVGVRDTCLEAEKPAIRVSRASGGQQFAGRGLGICTPNRARGLTTNAFLLRIPPMSEDGIEYLDVLPLLRGAITTFARSVESAGVDPDNGEYVNITHLVRHLIGRLAAGQTEEFPAVFAVVERVLADGDRKR